MLDSATKSWKRFGRNRQKVKSFRITGIQLIAILVDCKPYSVQGRALRLGVEESAARGLEQSRSQINDYRPDLESGHRIRLTAFLTRVKRG